MQINKIQSNYTTPIIRSKKTKSNNNISFEAAKTKAFMGAGSALAASALFSLSKESGINPSNCVNDFYQNELSFTPQKGKLERSLNRFTAEERYEIQQNLDEIKLFPNVFRTIADLKTNDTEYRFDAEDTMTLFLESAKEIEENPKVFEQIINIKDKEGNPRFSANDCVVLLNNAKYISNNTAKFIALAEGADENGIPMHDTNECISILRNLPQKEEAEAEAEAIKKKKNEPEKLKSLIARIRESDDKNPIILNTGEVVSKETAGKIQKNYVIYNHACRELIKLKNSDGSPRFTEKEICDLLTIIDELRDKNASRIYSYLTYANDDNTPDFTNEQCIKMLKDSDYKACMTAGVMFHATKPDYSLRFTPEEYVEFLTDKSISTIIAAHPHEFIAAASALNEAKEPKYSAEECLNICQDVVNYPDVFESLIKTHNKIYSLNIKPQDIIDLDEDFKFLYLSNYNRNVYSKVFELKEKFGIDKEVIKELKPFIAKNKKYIDVVTPQTFARFLEANYNDGLFDMANMQENIEHLRKFKMSKEKFEALMQLKEKHGLSPKVITELIIAG